MFTDNMIEKFTKRFQDLNKQKPDTPKNSSNNPVLNDLGQNEEEKEWAQMYSKKSFVEKQIPEVRFYQKQKQSQYQMEQRSQISVNKKSPNNQRKNILQKIKQNSSISKKNALQSQNKNKDQVNISKKNLRSSTKQVNKNQKKSYNKQENDSASNQKDQPHNNTKYERMKRLLIELKHAKMQDQRQKLIKNASNELKLEKSKLKLQLQGYKILVQIQDQTKTLTPEPSKKQLSRRFARKMLKYVQMNIKERKYKFITICRIVFKGLKLDQFRTNVWIDKFINQNKDSLKGINLNEYSTHNLPLLKGEQVKDKNKQKTDKRNQKDYEKQKFIQQYSQLMIKNESKQPKIQKDFMKKTHQKKEDKKTRSSGIISQQKKTQKFKIQQQKQKKITNQQKKQDRQKENNKKSKKKKTQEFIQSLIQKKRNEEIQQQKIKLNNKLKININNNYEQSKNNQQNKTKQIYYPESFSRKIANKLDKIFKQVKNKVFIQQSKQLCLEKDIILQMYSKYGLLNFKNLDQTLQNSQEFEKQFRRVNFYEFSNKYQQNIDDLLEGDDVNPYLILQNRLQYFINNNIRCTQEEIKQQAIKIATSHPDVNGKIDQQHLALWIHNYLKSINQKLYSNKVSSALEMINSEGSKTKGPSIYTSKKASINSINTNMKSLLSTREGVIQGGYGVTRPINIPPQIMKNQLQTSNYGKSERQLRTKK